MRIRTVLSSFVVVASLVMAACGDSDSPAGPGASIVGTWDMTSIDGQSLPITESEDFGDGMICSFTFSGAAVTFTSAGRYNSVTNGSFECTGSPAQTFSETDAGSYRVSGSTLFMTQDPEGGETAEEEPHTFSIVGSTLTISDNEGSTAVFERR